ncbi:MAG: hypothetical protein JSW15_00175 [Deltaproteobacteria bacterium]|nr:MAG: hypothetical protein JSW15_00175 [Deltaproteobacteria bacterium]
MKDEILTQASVHLNRKTNEGKSARFKVIGKECEQIAEVIYSKIKDDLEEIVRKAF